MASLYRKIVSKINLYKQIPLSVTELSLQIKGYLPKNPTILEAGAHLGFDTYGIAKIWPKGIIHAFEPIPHLYNQMYKRLQHCENVRTYNVALGESNGEIEMYVSSGDSTASSSILKPTNHLEMFPTVAFKEKITVPVRRLSDWKSTEKIAQIDLLWLDMQGYEVYALKGAGEVLQDVSVIYTELCKTELYAGLVTENEYIEFLNSHGFTLISTTGDGEVNEGIFINRKAIEKRK